MAEIVFVTGGSRSGKSAYAQQLAERRSSRRLYVATCPVIDDEMRRRIEAHQRARQDRGWDTVEEQLDLSGVLDGHAQYDVALVDCLTLWVNNLMYQAQQAGALPPCSQAPAWEQDSAKLCFGEDELAPPSLPAHLPTNLRLVPAAEDSRSAPPSLTESDIVRRCVQVIQSARGRTGTVIFVGNEVGMGIVPENADARLFRDLAGRANQVFAAGADAVTLLVSGIPWHLKGNPA